MFEALQHASVEVKYINIIREIYPLGTVYIVLEENSRIFHQSRGTKQGD